jgi:hypothetical protein
VECRSCLEQVLLLLLTAASKVAPLAMFELVVVMSCVMVSHRSKQVLAVMSLFTCASLLLSFSHVTIAAHARSN